MKKALLVAFGLALVCFLATDAHAVKNDTGKWALHDAGTHNAKTNTCDLVISTCASEINVVGGGGGAREDIYVLAIDVTGIAGTRYGICCDGPVYFYGWTKCSDFEIPTTGWPGCGEANAQTWTAEVAGPHVTVGILDAYIYSSTQCISVCVDSRVGSAEFCDGSEPSPICFSTASAAHFGSVAFNGSACGYNPCGVVPAEQRSWGAVKSIYR